MTDPRQADSLSHPQTAAMETTDSGFPAGDAPAAPSERMIDMTLEQSFPASDPPGWTLGFEPVPGRQPADDPEEES